ncbi:MAG: hypothetical protein ACW99H_04035 [Candidatus Thorarchaeota archaeon]|jgi:hypothetical protein
MTSDILVCYIFEEETGAPLFSHFIDPELKKNPSVIQQRMRSREVMLLHELGNYVVYSVLVKKETSEARELLRKFAKRVDKVYPEGLKRGQGKLADYVILENIVTEIFIDGE